MSDEVSLEVSQDSKNLALINWIGTIFFGFIPGLAFYLAKKDDAFVREHAKEALNWSITAFIGYIVGMLLMVILVGFLILAVVGVCHLVFSIMGVIAAAKGNAFKVPFTIRLLK